MRIISTISLCAVLLTAQPALGHRVNIFAYVETDAIIVECAFNKSSKVKNGKVEALDAVTKTVLMRGTTDDKGVCRLPIPTAVRTTGHDLLIRIIAGEGHQNEWLMRAEELTAVQNTAASTLATAERADTGAFSTKTTTDPQLIQDSATQDSTITAPTAAAHPLTQAEVEHIITQALDSRLAPLTRMLASATDGPTLRDILGGLGWLLGLAGIMAYARSRKS